MRIEIVNERYGWGYDESGQPHVLIDGVWRKTTGGHLHGSKVVVGYRIHARREGVTDYDLAEPNWCKRP